MKNRNIIVAVSIAVILIIVAIFLFKDRGVDIVSDDFPEKRIMMENQDESRLINNQSINSDEVMKIDVAESEIDAELNELENMEF